MKKIKLTITEFLQFRQLAEKLKIQFTHGVIRRGEVEVLADKTKLELIGY